MWAIVLFLLNDVVLDLDLKTLASPTILACLPKAPLSRLIGLSCEAFAREPALARASPLKASRLAVMLALKQPEINGACFSALAAGCPPESVSHRFASIAAEMIFDLKGLQDQGRLGPGVVDSHIWSLI